MYLVTKSKNIFPDNYNKKSIDNATFHHQLRTNIQRHYRFQIPDKKEKYLPLLEKEKLSALDIIKINKTIFETDKDNKKFNQNTAHTANLIFSKY